MRQQVALKWPMVRLSVVKNETCITLVSSTNGDGAGCYMYIFFFFPSPITFSFIKSPEKRPWHEERGGCVSSSIGGRGIQIHEGRKSLKRNNNFTVWKGFLP